MFNMKNSSKSTYKESENASLFHLTFAFELLNIDVWHDCEEGLIDLGLATNGLRIQYHLYPGQTFELDVLVWPHVAKIAYGTRHNWVRTFQYLQKRWFAFSIKHAIPVRVHELINFVATVNISFGTGTVNMAAKNDKIGGELYIPPLKFGEKRYFAPVIEHVESVYSFINRLIWKPLLDFIPATCMDTTFDTPTPVTDIRHQDTLMYKIQEKILNKIVPELSDAAVYETKPVETSKRKIPSPSKSPSKVKKITEPTRVKLEIKLSGNAILSGTGRVTPFEVEGESPLNSDFGDIIVMIGSCNLPAHDDVPITFLNVDNLLDVPVEEFKKNRVSHLYLQWRVQDDIYISEHIPWTGTKDVNFNYHQTVPLPCNVVSEYVASFLDNSLSIELRGVRPPKTISNNDTFFGYNKEDKTFGIAKPPEVKKDTLDFLIAETRIDARTFCKGANKFIQGDYTLHPPRPHVEKLNREFMCTNDINAIRAKVLPEIIIQPSAILESHMSLEASFGFVGCKPQKLEFCYSRLYCTITNSELIISVMKRISAINEEILMNDSRDEMLTGFALDTGDLVFLYAEGPRDGAILSIWEMLEEYHGEVTPIFSSSARYVTRLYPDFLRAPMPFNILKMHASLGVLLACPPVYVRPSLPLPSREAILKIGRLLMNKTSTTINRSQMPTAAELKSFRLELCAPPKPIRFLSNVENPLHQLIPDSGLKQNTIMFDSLTDLEQQRSGQRTSFSAETKKDNK